MDTRPRDGEAWSVTGIVSRAGKSPKGIYINNATHFVSTIGNCYELREILEDLRLAPYESYVGMEQYEKEGYREFFLQWEIGQTPPFFFVLVDNKITIVRILYLATKYVGEFGVEDCHSGEVVAFVG